ncbi:unnamed protein product [Notodromas monacha]|uniref:Uncharacterized protein n=1 Tax=Notodromas monacha TaxID=399045 RepID=A0A7R9GJD2_9CRUS|nr:unnamed protein product [Notodromas monacha]CAG0924734.1 unnamed protein product [Notodromas monacha]
MKLGNLTLHVGKERALEKIWRESLKLHVEPDLERTDMSQMEVIEGGTINLGTIEASAVFILDKEDPKEQENEVDEAIMNPSAIALGPRTRDGYGFGLSLLKTPNDYPIYPCVGRPPYWSCNGGIVEGRKASAKHTHTGTAGRTGQCLVMPYYVNPDATGAEGNIFKKFVTSEWFLQEEPFNLEIILPRAKNADTTTPYHCLAVGSLVELKTSPILGIVMIMTEAGVWVVGKEGRQFYFYENILRVLSHGYV